MRALAAGTRRFLGPKVLGFLALGLAIGLSLFAVELAFAYGLQAFLIAIGALDAQTARIPSWIPHERLGPVLGFIIVVGTLRALCNAGQIYLQGAAHEGLRHRLRTLLVRWALWSESASTAEVMTLFNARCDAAGVFVGNFQTLAIQLTSGVLLGAGLLVMAPMIILIFWMGLFPNTFLNYSKASIDHFVKNKDNYFLTVKEKSPTTLNAQVSASLKILEAKK